MAVYNSRIFFSVLQLCPQIVFFNFHIQCDQYCAARIFRSGVSSDIFLNRDSIRNQMLKKKSAIDSWRMGGFFEVGILAGKTENCFPMGSLMGIVDFTPYRDCSLQILKEFMIFQFVLDY